MDIDTLEAFKNKHTEWCECFSGSDSSSVLQQLWTLEDNSAINKAMLRMIELAEREESGTPKLPPLIFAALQRWYSNNHIIALRKLTEPYDGKRDKSRAKAVYSLRWLLDDMERYSALITRGNVVLIDGLTKDKDDVAKRRDEFLNKRMAERERFIWLPKELQPDPIERRQMFIDKICGTNSLDRSQYDRISKNLLSSFVSLLDKSCGRIKLYADKYLAHAATPESRELGEKDVSNLVWRDILEAEKVVCQVASVVEEILFANTGSILVPRIEPENLKYLDHPITKPDNIKLIEEAWHEYSREVGNWRDWDWVSLVTK